MRLIRTLVAKNNWSVSARSRSSASRARLGVLPFTRAVATTATINVPTAPPSTSSSNATNISAGGIRNFCGTLVWPKTRIVTATSTAIEATPLGPRGRSRSSWRALGRVSRNGVTVSSPIEPAIIQTPASNSETGRPCMAISAVAVRPDARGAATPATPTNHQRSLPRDRSGSGPSARRSRKAQTTLSSRLAPVITSESDTGCTPTKSAVRSPRANAASRIGHSRVLRLSSTATATAVTSLIGDTPAPPELARVRPVSRNAVTARMAAVPRKKKCERRPTWGEVSMPQHRDIRPNGALTQGHTHMMSCI